MIYLDLETTGLNPNKDEILQIGILSEDGKILMNKYLKPSKVSEWPSAQKVHGITPDKVKDCQTMDEVKDEIAAICLDQDVVIYNADYDIRFLPLHIQTGFKSVKCAMKAFAEFYGDWDDYHQSYGWKSLTFAASYVGHEWGLMPAHHAIPDCYATKSVWEFIYGRQGKDDIRSGKAVLSE